MRRILRAHVGRRNAIARCVDLDRRRLYNETCVSLGGSRCVRQGWTLWRPTEMSDDNSGKPANPSLSPEAKTIIGGEKPSDPQAGVYSVAKPGDRTVVASPTPKPAAVNATMIGQTAPKAKRPTMPGVNVTSTPQQSRP